MNHDAHPYSPIPLGHLAEIIDRARADNGDPTEVSRVQLSSDLVNLFEEVFTTVGAAEHGQTTAWDMIAEEDPLPTRRYKIFAMALDEARAGKDPLAVLRELSRDRSPSEMYLLQIRINSRGRSNISNIEKGIPELKTANWTELSNEQKECILLHLLRLENYYRRTQSKVPNATGIMINQAVLDLADLYARHTDFDGIPTDLPYAAKSRFIQFTCLALRPVVDPKKLSPGALSKRWRRIKGPTDG